MPAIGRDPDCSWWNLAGTDLERAAKGLGGEPGIPAVVMTAEVLRRAGRPRQALQHLGLTARAKRQETALIDFAEATAWWAWPRTTELVPGTNPSRST